MSFWVLLLVSPVAEIYLLFTLKCVLKVNYHCPVLLLLVQTLVLSHRTTGRKYFPDTFFTENKLPLSWLAASCSNTRVILTEQQEENISLTVTRSLLKVNYHCHVLLLLVQTLVLSHRTIGGEMFPCQCHIYNLYKYFSIKPKCLCNYKYIKAIYFI